MGRSPVFVTVSSTVRRPSFATISPSPSTYSPGVTLVSSANGVMNGDELSAVGKRPFDLNFFEHLRHALHHVVAAEHGEPGFHQLGHTPAVADALEDLGRDERERLRVIELEAASAPAARNLGRGEDEELLLLAGGEVHRRASDQTARCRRTISILRS